MSGEHSNHAVVNSPDHFKELLSKDLARVSLINFWADWAEPCKGMTTVIEELTKKYPEVLFLEVEAESQPDITDTFNVESVPTLVMLRGHDLLTRIVGADAHALTEALKSHTRKASQVLSKTSQGPAAPTYEGERQESKEELNKRLVGLMNSHKVVLFMKGVPDQPRCGFSRKAVALLRDQGVEFGHFDILTDESVRTGLKELNNWPTFPQFVVNGEFVGGLDVVNEMVDNGELKEVLE